MSTTSLKSTMTVDHISIRPRKRRTKEVSVDGEIDGERAQERESELGIKFHL